MRTLSQTILLCLVPVVLYGQGDISSPDTLPWYQFQQEGLLSNRSLWTFEDNPALAGFDRKLNVTYDYRVQNMALFEGGGDWRPPSYDYQQHRAGIDAAIGPSKNWGTGLAFLHDKAHHFTYYQLMWSQSYRIRIRENHNLMVGTEIGFIRGNYTNTYFTFNDMIDPRFGFVYPTNERTFGDAKTFWWSYGAGIAYTFKRLTVGYAFKVWPTEVYAGHGPGYEPRFRHRLQAAYWFRLGEKVNLSTAVSVFNERNKRWIAEPAVSLIYMNRVFVQLELRNADQFGFTTGFQIKDLVTFTVSSRTHLRPESRKYLGVADLRAGIRFQIRTGRKK